MVWVSWVLGDTQSLSLHKVKSFSPFPRAKMYMAIHFSPETQENQWYCYDNYNILKQLCVTKSLYVFLGLCQAKSIIPLHILFFDRRLTVLVAPVRSSQLVTLHQTAVANSFSASSATSGKVSTSASISAFILLNRSTSAGSRSVNFS